MNKGRGGNICSLILSDVIPTNDSVNSHPAIILSAGR